MQENNENVELTYIPGDIYSNIERWINVNKNIKFALITIIDIDGRSPYPIGTQMAINNKGEYAGYLTSGCAEKAILQHALTQITQRKMLVERYGKGSDYFDIVLPCGSGISVLIDPIIENTLFNKILASIRQRKAFSVTTHFETGSHVIELENENSAKHSYLGDNYFYHFFQPTPRLIIAGQGPIVSALSELALKSNFCVDVFCDDAQSISNSANTRLTTDPTKILKAQLEKENDNYSGFISLFHEHDKEIVFLASCLKKTFFYIGALGSHTSHENRINTLRDLEFSHTDISRIHAPIGLPIKAKTPEHIAISILAEIISKLN